MFMHGVLLVLNGDVHRCLWHFKDYKDQGPTYDICLRASRVKMFSFERPMVALRRALPKEHRACDAGGEEG